MTHYYGNAGHFTIVHTGVCPHCNAEVFLPITTKLNFHVADAHAHEMASAQVARDRSRSPPRGARAGNPSPFEPQHQQQQQQHVVSDSSQSGSPPALAPSQGQGAHPGATTTLVAVPAPRTPLEQALQSAYLLAMTGHGEPQAAQAASASARPAAKATRKPPTPQGGA